VNRAKFPANPERERGAVQGASSGIFSNLSVSEYSAPGALPQAYATRVLARRHLLSLPVAAIVAAEMGFAP
jgi:hypothetical protein